MKIFISSLIADMGDIRATAKEAVQSLDLDPVMAEDFGARPQSPQLACLAGVRGADAVVLVMGAGYGAMQGSGISATHEEYREARDTQRPIFLFVQEGTAREGDQEAFLAEARGWSNGQFYATFQSVADLRIKVTQALHRWQLSRVTGPIDGDELLRRALGGVADGRDRSSQHSPLLAFSLAGGPEQAVLRPSEIEEAGLLREVHREALFGDVAVLHPGGASEVRVEAGRLTVRQATGLISLGPDGSVLLYVPLTADTRATWQTALLEEVVRERLLAALGFSSWLLGRVDQRERLSHVAVAARIVGADHHPWRTRQEQERSPNSYTIPHMSGSPPPVHLRPAHMPRAALRADAARLADDFLVLLRRQWNQH